MSKSPTLSIYLDARNMQPGRISVKYTVYFEGKQKQYPTGLVVSEPEAEFLKQNRSGLSGRVKNDKLRNLWNRVYGEEFYDEDSMSTKESVLAYGKRCLLQVESYFTFQIFAQVLSGKYAPSDASKPTDTDIIKALEAAGAKDRKNGNISSAECYESTAKSLRRYSVSSGLAKTFEKVELPIMAVNSQFLKNYEKWMREKGSRSQKAGEPDKPASITTVSIYTRYIRIIWNEAIKDKVAPKESYPFNTAQNRGYKIAKVANKKKALDQDTITKIFQYECEVGSSRQKYRDLWLISYLCNGINVVDLCGLRNSDYNTDQGIIEFFRDKTIDTKRDNLSKIRIYLLPEAIELIEKWRNPRRDNAARLFDFIKDGSDAEEEARRSAQVVWNINRHMRLIGRELGINSPIRVYEARHSFATALMNADAPVTLIKDSFGHSDIATTQRYIASVDTEKAKHYVANLIPAKIRQAIENETKENE